MDEALWLTFITPPLLGLTSTVSLKLAPAQAASAGFAVNSTVINSGKTKTKTNHGLTALPNFVVIFSPHMVCVRNHYSIATHNINRLLHLLNTAACFFVPFSSLTRCEKAGEYRARLPSLFLFLSFTPQLTFCLCFCHSQMNPLPLLEEPHPRELS